MLLVITLIFLTFSSHILVTLLQRAYLHSIMLVTQEPVLTSKFRYLTTEWISPLDFKQTVKTSYVHHLYLPSKGPFLPCYSISEGGTESCGLPSPYFVSLLHIPLSFILNNHQVFFFSVLKISCLFINLNLSRVLVQYYILQIYVILRLCFTYSYYKILT